VKPITPKQGPKCSSMQASTLIASTSISSRPTDPGDADRIRSALRVGARRAVSESNDLGVRLEADDRVDGHLLLGARIVDWRHRFTDHFAMALFWALPV